VVTRRGKPAVRLTAAAPLSAAPHDTGAPPDLLQTPPPAAAA
jgi:hypothetical protein